MRAIIIFMCIFFSTDFVVSQNIVRNGDFENYSRIPPVLFNNLNGWYRPTSASTDLHIGYFGWRGQIIKPYSGNAFIGLIVHDVNYEYAEYATNKFSSKLKKDSLYCLCMQITLSIGTSYAPRSLDVFMSKERIKRWTKKPVSNYYNSNLSINSNSYLSNREFWKKYCIVYKSKGGEKYMSLGFFSKKFEYIQVFESPSNDYGHNYILIDNVSLIPISDSSQCDCNKSRTDFDQLLIEENVNDRNHEQSLKVGQIVKFNDLHFANSSFEIDSNAYGELDMLYAILSRNTSLIIQINGHTDANGPDRVNNRLSTNRAKAVATYLINKGIQSERIGYKGYGANYPIATNATEEGRTENRRVEFEIVR